MVTAFIGAPVLIWWVRRRPGERPVSVDFGRRVLGSVRTERVRAVTPAPALVVCRARAGRPLAVGVLALGTGEFTLTPAEVLRALSGEGTRAARLVVVEWRMPRVLLALVIGAALGLAGAVFQAPTRNPLGSPDVIGFSTGAYTGVLLVTVRVRQRLLRGRGRRAGRRAGHRDRRLPAAFKRGVQGFRLIIVGIAISAMLTSVNQWFIIKVDLQAAFAAMIWGQGSLNGLGWAQVTPVWSPSACSACCSWSAPACPCWSWARTRRRAGRRWNRPGSRPCSSGSPSPRSRQRPPVRSLRRPGRAAARPAPDPHARLALVPSAAMGASC